MAKSKSKPMKLAEALMLRGELEKKIESLKSRIGNYAAVQEGEKAAEDPHKLLKMLDGVVNELVALIIAINEANLKARLSDGRSLTSALAARDGLMKKHAGLNSAIGGANRQPDRYGLKEVRWIRTVDVASLQNQADDVARKIRELNAMIQEANWKMEVELT